MKNDANSVVMPQPEAQGHVAFLELQLKGGCITRVPIAVFDKEEDARRHNQELGMELRRIATMGKICFEEKDGWHPAMGVLDLLRLLGIEAVLNRVTNMPRVKESLIEIPRPTILQ